MATQTGTSLFTADALPANREGSLTDEQRQRYRNMAKSKRQGQRGFAWVPLVIGILLLVANGTAVPALARTLLGAAFIAVAVGLVLWSMTGADALTRDLRQGHVESVEGAIARRQDFATGKSSGQAYYYYLEVAGRTFEVSNATYEAAPSAGFVRAYFLPRSHRLVNLERLPDRVTPESMSLRDAIQEIGAARGSHDQIAQAEANADLMALADAYKAQVDKVDVTRSAPPPPGGRDPRPLQQAIVGTWRNPLMTVTFLPDGTVTAALPLGQRQGRWSVDAAGRLVSDVTGQQEAADAWVAGDTLTISAQGEGLTFTRAAAG